MKLLASIYILFGLLIIYVDPAETINVLAGWLLAGACVMALRETRKPLPHPDWLSRSGQNDGAEDGRKAEMMSDRGSDGI